MPSKTIWKFPLELIKNGHPQDRCTVSMPGGAQIIALQVQESVPTIWAIVDPLQKRVNRTFVQIGTGHPLDREVVGPYIGTWQAFGYVFHVFEE